MIIDIYSIFGWVGVAIIIISHILFSSKKLKMDYTIYHLLNFLGAMGLAVSTYITESWPALTLSLIFAGISVVYIARLVSAKPVYKEWRVE